MLRACIPPFNAAPECFPISAYQMLSSQQCAVAWGDLYNVTDSSIMLRISANVQALNDACNAVDSQVPLKPPYSAPLLPPARTFPVAQARCPGALPRRACAALRPPPTAGIRGFRFSVSQQLACRRHV